MARVTLTPVMLAGAQGLTLPTAGVQALTGFTGVQFVNNGQLMLVVYNGTGSQTITQNIGGKVQGLTPTVAPVSLTASTNTMWGPWSQKDYTQLDGTGMQYIDFGGTQANLTVTLYQLSQVP
jgi:hypothetical protein